MRLSSFPPHRQLAEGKNRQEAHELDRVLGLGVEFTRSLGRGFTVFGDLKFKHFGRRA